MVKSYHWHCYCVVRKGACVFIWFALFHIEGCVHIWHT